MDDKPHTTMAELPTLETRPQALDRRALTVLEHSTTYTFYISSNRLQQVAPTFHRLHKLDHESSTIVENVEVSTFELFITWADEPLAFLSANLPTDTDALSMIKLYAFAETYDILKLQQPVLALIAKQLGFTTCPCQHSSKCEHHYRVSMDETADREFLTPEEVRGVYDIEDRKQQLRSLVRLLIPYYDFSARRDLGRYPKQFLVDAVRARRMDDEDDEGFVDEIEIVDDGKDNDGGEVVEKDEEDNKEKDNEDGEEINKIDERVEANGDVKMGSEVG